jgi:hypothetical protein
MLRTRTHSKMVRVQIFDYFRMGSQPRPRTLVFVLWVCAAEPMLCSRDWHQPLES